MAVRRRKKVRVYIPGHYKITIDGWGRRKRVWVPGYYRYL